MAQAKESTQYQRMMETPIPRLVTALALPTVISMIISVIYNTADTYFVSQINKSASAAVGAVFSVMSLIQAVGFGFAMGAGSLVSLRLGEKKKADADRYASSAFFAAILIGGLVGGLGLLFLEPMLKLLGCSKTMLPYAIPYARYILLAAPISCSTFVLNNTLRSEGHALFSMIGMGFGGILNLILDPILIFGFHMDTGGAALATAISQLTSFLILLSMFLLGRSEVSLHPRHVSRTLADYKKIVLTGLPTVCRQGLGSVASAVLNIQAVVYGDATVAAISIANKVYMLVRNVVVGIGQGFQPVAGYNYGAGNKRRTWQAFRFASLLGTAFCLIATVGIALLAEPLLWWFCDDAEVALIGRETLLFFCIAIPMMAISTYVNMLLQSLGFRLSASLLASCRQGFFFFPLVLLLPLFFQRTGVQITQAGADILTFLISVPVVIRFYRRHLRETDGDGKKTA